jgi:hypothetical protein
VSLFTLEQQFRPVFRQHPATTLKHLELMALNITLDEVDPARWLL